jgi:hypothetical protein
MLKKVSLILFGIFIGLLLKEQTYWPIVSTLVDNPAAYDVDWPTEWVKTWCEDQDIFYLDLTPVFRAHAAQGEQFYFRYDAHWNERGHGLVAQTIRKYLQEAGILLTSSIRGM